MNRSHYLKTRLTPEEHAQLKARAARAGLKVSEFVRAAIAAMKPIPHALPSVAEPVAEPIAKPESVTGPSNPTAHPYAYERK